VIAKAFYPAVFLVLLLISCNNIREKKITLSEPEILHLENLSSASGIGVHNSVYYIVGDDTPWLYSLNSNFDVSGKTQISGIDSLYNGRTPKDQKADFECADIISDNEGVYLFILSSGSMKISRDTAHIVGIESNNYLHSKSLRPLYEKIKLKAGLPTKNEINIEGIAFSKEHVYLLHRGNVSENIIIKINRSKFIKYIKSDSPIPQFEIYAFDLPIYQEVASGFSGACVLPDNTGLIFTASMEDTKDEINDGKVLGSFIGIIPFSGIEDGNYIATLVTDNGLPVEKKLEGVCIISNTDNNNMVLVTVCDNDDGTSDIIKIKMEIN